MPKSTPGFECLGNQDREIARLTCFHPTNSGALRSPSQKQHHRWQKPSELELILSKLLTELSCKGGEEGPLA